MRRPPAALLPVAVAAGALLARRQRRRALTPAAPPPAPRRAGPVMARGDFASGVAKSSSATTTGFAGGAAARSASRSPSAPAAPANAPAAPLAPGERFVSVPWTLVAAPADRAELTLRCAREDGMALDRVDAQETPTLVFVTALMRRRAPAGDRAAWLEPLAATVSLSRPLGDRELVHAPLDVAPPADPAPPADRIPPGDGEPDDAPV